MKNYCSARAFTLSSGVVLVILLILSGCKKSSDYSPIPLTSYYNQLQVGKYVTYRLDSLNYYYYGQLDTLTSYLAKDSVEEAITDNQGRPSWRVVRYLTDTLAVNPWAPTETYMVTATPGTIEVVENNLRTVRLAYPMNNGYNWTGDTYLPYAPYQDYFDFSDNSHLDLSRWNFTYQNVNGKYQLGAQTFDSTVTVVQINDSINVPVLDTMLFGSRALWTEVYAKHIGLIQRTTQMWEYQPPAPPVPPATTPPPGSVGFKIGFSVFMRIVDHN